MTVTVKQIAGLLILIVPTFVVLYAVNANKDATLGLTGATRSQFVNGALELCAKKPAANKQISAQLQVQYCTCVADGMAARLSNDDMKSLNPKSKDEVMATLQPTMDAAIAPCAEQALKTLNHPAHSN